MSKHIFFRLVKKQRSGRQALTSKEGRFSRPGSADTTYAASDLETAWLEILSIFGSLNPNPDAFRVLKLTVEEPILISVADSPEMSRIMVDPWPSLARDFGDRARDEEFEGIAFPSMRRAGGTCVALFLEKLEGRVEVEEVSSDVLGDVVRRLGGG